MAGDTEDIFSRRRTPYELKMLGGIFLFLILLSLLAGWFLYLKRSPVIRSGIESELQVKYDRALRELPSVEIGPRAPFTTDVLKRPFGDPFWAFGMPPEILLSRQPVAVGGNELVIVVKWRPGLFFGITGARTFREVDAAEVVSWDGVAISESGEN